VRAVRQGELSWQTVARAVVAEGCHHLGAAYAQKTARASLGAVAAVLGSDTVFGQIGGDCPSSPAPAPQPGVRRSAAK